MRTAYVPSLLIVIGTAEVFNTPRAVPRGRGGDFQASRTRYY